MVTATELMGTDRQSHASAGNPPPTVSVVPATLSHFMSHPRPLLGSASSTLNARVTVGQTADVGSAPDLMLPDVCVCVCVGRGFRSCDRRGPCWLAAALNLLVINNRIS